MANCFGKDLSYGQAKIQKITLKQRIWLLLFKIKQYDKPFSTLNENDANESKERINFLIGDEQNLQMLNDYNFKLFINQVQDFYEINKSESLVDWNYKMHIIDDFINEETISKIVKVADDLNDSFSMQYNQETNFWTQKIDETIFSNQNEFCDVTIASDDQYITTHQPVLPSMTSEKVYNTLSEELLRDMCEELMAEILEEKVVNLRHSKVIYEDILKEICAEVSADVIGEIDIYSRSIFDTVSEELFTEISREVYTEVVENISNNFFEDLCDEISCDLWEEVISEVITHIPKISNNLFKNVFEELSNEIYNEICFAVLQEEEDKIDFSKLYMIKTGELNIYSTKENLAQNSTISSDFDIECDDKIIESSSIIVSNCHNNYNCDSIYKEIEDVLIYIKKESDNQETNLIFINQGIMDENLFSCEKCDKEFECDLNLKKHKETFHEKQLYSCKNCDIKTTNENHNNVHEKSQYEPFSGYKIKENSTSQYKINFHFKTDLTETQSKISYSYEDCFIKFKKKVHLKIHIKSDFSYCD